MSEAVDRQIVKYQEWAAKLETNIEDMARQRRWSWAYLAGGTVAGGIAWRFHHFLGGALFTLGLVLWSTAIYITYMRTWYYQNELRRTRHEIDTLVDATTPPSGSEKPGTKVSVP